MADEAKTERVDEKPKESSKGKPKKDKKDKKKVLANVRKVFWIAITILIFLLLISLVLLSTRMYEYVRVTDEDRPLSIVADEVREFDIFSAVYKDGKGEVFIKSNNGDNVIAPGASTDYTIRIKNEDDIALNYTFRPIVEIVTPSDPEDESKRIELPLRVKLITDDQEYLVGNAKTWGSFEDFANIDYTATIAKNEVQVYELRWYWPFERGEDIEDTFLGNLGAGEVSISVGMSLHSEVNTSAEANKTPFDYGVAEIIIPIIFFILLLIAIILLIISLIRRKENEPEPVVVFVPETKPEPKPVPPAPTPIVNKKKAKGFVGKMEFVNIDTLVSVFNDGDTITLSILKEKGLVNPKATQVKILARGDDSLDKAFHIETQGVSAQARAKIIEAGGTIKIIDG